jgi:hypothetical protein
MGKIKIGKILVGILLLVTIVSPLFHLQTVSAAQITSRSLTLQTGAGGVGGSLAGGVVNHLFSFTIPGGGNVGSIQFLYCTTASGTCTTPTGLVTTAAALTGQTGATGFTIVNTTNGAPYITRTAANITAQAVTYTLSTITNPTTPNQTFYVRISTFVSNNATTGVTDIGTVAASTATQIVLSGTMPESLIFCAGSTIGTTAGIPDCSKAGVGTVSFNQLFSPADTATATSQMAASTNAGTGYVISVNGTTLTSGSNTVTAMGAPTTSAHGVSQFGLNLKLNTTATSTIPVGAEITPSSNGTNLRGEALAGYNTVDTFKFINGDNVADSGDGGLGGTDAQIYTTSYIVNVPGSQPAGTYTTTLTYVCTPTF